MEVSIMVYRYGGRFHDAVQMLRTGMKNEDSLIQSNLDNYINIPVPLLDKYPLAIRRLIRIIWEHLEFYLNYFSGCGEVDDEHEMVIQAVAELEALESELNEMKGEGDED